MDVRTSGLTEPRRRLLAIMRQAVFGRIENLPVRGGEPVLDGLRLVREVKFGAQAEEYEDRGGALKAQAVELLAWLDQRRDCLVRVLEFKHGLPFRMTVEECAA